MSLLDVVFSVSPLLLELRSPLAPGVHIFGEKRRLPQYQPKDSSAGHTAIEWAELGYLPYLDGN